MKMAESEINVASAAKALLENDDGKSAVKQTLRMIGADADVAAEELSVRAFNCLTRKNKTKITDLIDLYPEGFLQIRNLGVKTVEELKAFVENYTQQFLPQIEAFLRGEDPGQLPRNSCNLVLEQGEKADSQQKMNVDSGMLSVTEMLHHPDYRKNVIEYFQKIIMCRKAIVIT